MSISEDRLHHIIAVARLMKRTVEDFPSHYSLTPEEAFTLGMLHDIGYEFTDNSQEHGNVGGNVLCGLGYQYWREIMYHGKVDCTYKSDALDLLNIVDMTTGPDGTYVTMQERVNEAADRYGENSPQHIAVVKMAEHLSDNK